MPVYARFVELDFETCWRASQSRDARFDGRFFIGVRSTGIYCRPVCPAPSPKRENVTFYATAAAASDAGLRPCKRCRPELAPGTPEWIGGSALVARALRLIDDGYLDRAGVPDLARELCIGERQLRRLFAAHLGAPPGSLARTRRLQLARALVDQTALPMTEVAAASGFTSLRQFNASMRAAYGRPPRQLRRARTRPTDRIVLRLPYRPPLAWDELLAYLSTRAVPGVESVDDRSYRRTLDIGGAPIVVELEHAAPAVMLTVAAPSAESLGTIVERARRAFDLDADPAQVALVLGADPILGPLVERRPGLRVPGAWDGFELAVRAVLGQQVSVRGATTLAGRLVARFGTPLAASVDGLTHVFPRPEALVDADVAAIGIPGARAETIRHLARAASTGAVRLDATAPFEETRAALVALPGIGPWTAEYVALRVLRDPDAYPAGDLGLRNAGATLARAEAWRPWRGYAAVHLWTAGAEALETAA
jgi:AraC family transcriptional regulator of adaptative response / DNA-3-methyladenine glycosylase II